MQACTLLYSLKIFDLCLSMLTNWGAKFVCTLRYGYAYVMEVCKQWYKYVHLWFRATFK